MNKPQIIIINKPAGLTTNNLIQKVKGILKVKKIGHAGTLDPLATGVVICLINGGTKLSNYFLTENKSYEVSMQLFSATDSYDSDGSIIEEQVPFEITNKMVKVVVNQFNGYTYQQAPPIFSAIKVNGKRLYNYARSNQSVKIQLRKVTIHRLTLLAYNNKQITLRVSCSKGTYIRSLVVDIAKALNTIAHVTNLIRIKSGSFKLDQAVKLESIKNKDVISVYDAIKMSGYNLIKLDNTLAVSQGKKITLKTQADLVFIANKENEVLACYEREHGNIFKSKRGGLNL